MNKERVIFYSKEDLAAGHHLSLVENVLDAFDENAVYEDVNAVLELASIRLYIKNELFLRSWDKERISHYKIIVDKFPPIIARFLNNWLGMKFSAEYDSIEYEYREIFWTSIADFGCFKSLAKDNFAIWLKTHEHELYDILKHEKLVNRFSAELLPVIKKSKIAAELLIEYSLFNPQNLICWPKAMSDSDKRQMVVDYIGNENFNVNYLMKIQESSRNAEPKIDNEIRLMAKQAYEKWFAKQQKQHRVGVQVSLLPSMDRPYRYYETKTMAIAEINSEWVKKHLDFQSIFLMLKEYFRLVDRDNRSILPFYEKDRLLIADMGVPRNNKEVYPKDCVVFIIHKLVYSSLIDAYRTELLKNGIYFENIFTCFFEKWLPVAYGINRFAFNSPSLQTTDLEKIKIILPEIERVLKIYKMFQKGNVDMDLLNSFSAPLGKWSELKSLSKRKYVYPGKEGYAVFKVLFSGHLSISPLLKSKDEFYDSFYERLQKETILYDDLDDYSRELLQHLVSAGCVSVKEGIVEYDQEKCNALKEIYDNELLNVLPLSSRNRQCIDGLIKTGIIEASDSLFSRNEQDYISFVWDDSFKNGLAIRNRYLHGAYPTDERQIHWEYIELLKLLVMIMINMDEEFAITSLS
ncbi:hypothetical protein IKQ19_20375 [Candidatus Saccharibacteria bacterium]|nr:hypothetical protein [Candidatus Saccharibacteria bacterium]